MLFYQILLMILIFILFDPLIMIGFIVNILRFVKDIINHNNRVV
jgi:hypothetical protein